MSANSLNAQNKILNHVKTKFTDVLVQLDANQLINATLPKIPFGFQPISKPPSNVCLVNNPKGAQG